MRKTATTLAFALAVAAPALASAATVTNRDAVPHTLVMSEGGNQSELVIGPGETMEVCQEGCFLTMPNGDRQALTGTEKLDIEASRGVIVE